MKTTKRILATLLALLLGLALMMPAFAVQPADGYDAAAIAAPEEAEDEPGDEEGEETDVTILERLFALLEEIGLPAELVAWLEESGLLESLLDWLGAKGSSLMGWFEEGPPRWAWVAAATLGLPMGIPLALVSVLFIPFSFILGPMFPIVAINLPIMGLLLPVLGVMLIIGLIFS